MSHQRNVAESALSPRSLILSLLLGMRAPVRAGSELVAWCELFGVSEGTARVALSRMVKAGELVSAEGRYELAGRIRRRQSEQERAVSPRLREHDGMWSMVMVVADARAARDRAALRADMRHARYAERRSGVWLRPNNLELLRTEAIAQQCEHYLARPPAERRLADDLFDPRAWNDRARRVSDDLQTTCRILESGVGATRVRSPSQQHARTGDRRTGDRRTDIAEAFLLGTQAMATLRADPLLPPELVSPRWSGERLRTQYQRYHAAFSRAVNEWFVSL